VLQQAASIHDLKLPTLLPGIAVYTSAVIDGPGRFQLKDD
jgi:hypothetical protein